MLIPDLGGYVDWRQLYAESKAAGMLDDKKKKKKVKDSRKKKEDRSLDRDSDKKKETPKRRIKLTNNPTGQVSKSGVKENGRNGT